MSKKSRILKHTNLHKKYLLKFDNHQALGAPAPQEKGELPGFTGVGDVNGVFSLIDIDR